MTCKKEQLILTFAIVNVSLKGVNVSFKLRKKIDPLIMEAKIQNNHSEKQKLGKKLEKYRQH